MPLTIEALPDDLNELKAMLLAERARNERLVQIIKEMQRHRFRRRDASRRPDAAGAGGCRADSGRRRGGGRSRSAVVRSEAARRRQRNRGALPAHLPHIETTVDIEDKACPCCKGLLHKVGEDVSERLDIVPAQFRVLVTRRPKYACRACEGAVECRARAPARLIEGGLPTEATLAHVLVSKYADHLPLYRQAQIYARRDRARSFDARRLDRRAAWHLRPVHERLLERIRSSTKIFADETTAPVLESGRGRTKTGQLWAYARDDRPFGGADPPIAVYVYAQNRKSEQPIAHLHGFSGVLQVDGYAGYRALAQKNSVRLAFCWSHVRRRFYELAAAGPAPIANEALTRIGALYAIESEIRGQNPDERCDARQEKARPDPQCLRTLAARKTRVDQPEEQARGSDPLRALTLGRLSPLCRRRARRDELQRRRTRDQAHCAQSEERSSSPVRTAVARTGRSLRR